MPVGKAGSRWGIIKKNRPFCSVFSTPPIELGPEQDHRHHHGSYVQDADANLHGMERLLRFLRAVLRARPWSSEAMTATRLRDLDHDPSQGVRHVVRWDRIGGG
jgi:hypothetical protein